MAADGVAALTHPVLWGETVVVAIEREFQGFAFWSGRGWQSGSKEGF
jgi:hypothetical protein